MRCRLAGAALCLTLLIPGTADPATATAKAGRFPRTPALTVSIAPEWAATHAIVGAEILVTIRLISRHPFDALRLTPLTVTGASLREVLRPRTRTVTSYAGSGTAFETAIALYPDRAGTLTIPALTAVGETRPPAGDPRQFRATSAAITLPVAAIDPRFEGDRWMVSDAVEISESWSQPPATAVRGDVLRRTVRLTAAGVPAAAMVRPRHGKTIGVTLVEAGSESHTEVTARGVIGTLTRSWDLQIENSGVVYISPVSVAYYDPSAGARRKIGVRGYRLEVARPDPAAAAARLMEAALAAHRQRWILVWVLAAGVAVPVLAGLGALAWLLAPTAADRALLRACRKADSAAALWRQIAAGAGTTGVRPPPTLTAAVFDPAAPMPALASVIADLRRQMRARRRQAATAWLAGVRTAMIGPRQDL